MQSAVLTDNVIKQIRRFAVTTDSGAMTDGQLVEVFSTNRDHDAFTTLVHRHGPMVYGVCLRILANTQDAEDAFQAVFIIVVQKAASLKKRQTIGNWLYGVAYKTALKARALRERRRQKEQAAMINSETDDHSENAWEELAPLLDEELRCLPDKYREPIVLCELEGKSRKEAALQLGWPEGTVAGRLARGRVRLAQRLKRRGVTFAGGSLAALVCQHAVSASVPTPLVAATIESAGLGINGQHIACLLAKSLMRDMTIGRLRMCLAFLGVMVAVATLVAGFARATDHSDSGPTTKVTNVAKVVVAKQPVAGANLYQVWSIAWRPDGEQIASASYDGVVRIWSLNGKVTHELKGHQRPVTSVAWSPDGTRLASAGFDGTVRIWKRDGTPGPILKGHNGVVATVAWSADGKYLASGGFGDYTVRIWHADGTSRAVLKGHTQRVNSVAWHPKRNVVASGSYDGTVRLWDGNGRLLGQRFGPGILKSRGGYIYSVAWAKNGMMLAAGNHDGSISLWNMDDPKLRKDEGPSQSIKAHDSYVLSLSWSRDGNKLASSGADKTIRIWNADLELQFALKGHDDSPKLRNRYSHYVHSVAWSPDQKQLLSGGMDGTIRLWDAEKGKVIWVRGAADSPPPRDQNQGRNSKNKSPLAADVKEKTWPRNTVDYHVLAQMEAKHLKPSPDATRYTLARRAALTLTGLPPRLDQLNRFLDDKSPNAYEAMIDRLLKSKAHQVYWAIITAHHEKPADLKNVAQAESWAAVMWQQVFGQELNSTSHPRLKQHLATLAKTWDDAKLLRLLTTSATFRQSSDLRGDLRKKDRKNEWMARYPTSRLPNWILNRCLLFLSGLPNKTAKLIPEQQLKPQPKTKKKSFSTPPAALVLPSQEYLIKATAAIARQILLKGGKTDEDKVRFAFMFVLGRPVTQQEHARVDELFRDLRKKYAKDANQPRRLLTNLGIEMPGDLAEAAVWTNLGLVLVNTSEFVFKR